MRTKNFKFVFQIILVAGLFCFCYNAKAQTPCEMNPMYYYNIYVFSDTKNYNWDEILGAKINPVLVNVIFVSTKEKKNEIDSLVLQNKLETSIFVYPKHDASKTIRFCNQQEYSTAIKNKMELQIVKE